MNQKFSWTVLIGGSTCKIFRCTPPTGPNSFVFQKHFYPKVPVSEVHAPRTGPRPLWEILDAPLDFQYDGNVCHPHHSSSGSGNLSEGGPRWITKLAAFFDWFKQRQGGRASGPPLDPLLHRYKWIFAEMFDTYILIRDKCTSPSFWLVSVLTYVINKSLVYFAILTIS